MSEDKIKICSRCNKPIINFPMPDKKDPTKFYHEICYLALAMPEDSVFARSSPEEIREALTPSGPIQGAIPIRVDRPIKARDYILSQGLSPRESMITHPSRQVTNDTILEPGVLYILTDRKLMQGMAKLFGTASTQQASRESEKERSNCFIATVAYGSPTEPKLDILRNFRDTKMLKTRVGAKFVDLYYRSSPPFANLLRNSKNGRKIIRRIIDLIILQIEKK